MNLMCTESQTTSEDRCFAEDRTIFRDERAVKKLLETESQYVPGCDYMAHSHSNLQPFMRRVVATWMLDVSWIHLLSSSLKNGIRRRRRELIVIFAEECVNLSCDNSRVTSSSNLKPLIAAPAEWPFFPVLLNFFAPYNTVFRLILKTLLCCFFPY